MKLKLIFSFITGYLCLSPIYAQHTYTLDECVRQALVNNVRIKNAHNQIKMATHERKEAFTKYLPSVSASGGGFLADKGLIEAEAGGKLLSVVDDGMAGGVTASLPLFTGGQILNANKLAKLAVEISKLQLHQSEKEVRLTTENYYWQIVSLKAQEATLASMKDMMRNLYKDVETSVNAGLTTHNDLLQVQLKLNELESKQITLHNALSLSYMILGQYMGETADSIEVANTIEYDRLPSHPENLQCDHHQALLHTDEYHLLDKNIEANKLKYKTTLGKYMPTLAIGGGYMYDNFMNRDHSFWVGFATLSVPISDWWGGSHEIKKKKLEIHNAENNFVNGSELLLIKMQKAWNDVNDAYKQIQIAFQSIEQATENLRLNRDYYAAGIVTMNDLLDAQVLLQKSQDQYIEAYARYEIKKTEYMQSTGR